MVPFSWGCFKGRHKENHRYSPPFETTHEFFFWGPLGHHLHGIYAQPLRGSAIKFIASGLACSNSLAEFRKNAANYRRKCMPSCLLVGVCNVPSEATHARAHTNAQTVPPNSPHQRCPRIREKNVKSPHAQLASVTRLDGWTPENG